MPDLVAVIDAQGAKGYAYKTDLFGDDREPSSPGEAVRERATSTLHQINVYESDGETVVGHMEVGVAPGDVNQTN